ncbi:hypothetical protein LTR56_024455 [Elasticomyces elasticus]|nr:hypothetical protein LTR22_026488 [Elasticomyces elasticus]KAK3618752.1 hypothetical protein LTR56_024455 [Elasticomyces elasticus]KAK4905597.1 hypothetical protein LTR49_025135 [Elasticomyces elasticus]
MEVLSLGYSRTGTITMKAALEIIGIPTWHWVTMAEDPADLTMCAEVIEAKFDPGSVLVPFGRQEFDNLLGHWGACTDQPSVLSVEDFLQAYPETKVVLVERNPDGWMKACLETLIAGSANPFRTLRGGYGSWLSRLDRISDGLNREILLQGRKPQRYPGFSRRRLFFDEWRQKAKSTYLAPNEHVKRVVPADRLFIFHVADGVGTQLQTPESVGTGPAFPRVNETLAVQEKVKL